jgi:hypothetical protein
MKELVVTNLKSGGGFCMSTVVTLRLMVFSSASRYRSMKYSWQKRHAPFLRPSIVEACNILSTNFHIIQYIK